MHAIPSNLGFGINDQIAHNKMDVIIISKLRNYILVITNIDYTL